MAIAEARLLTFTKIRSKPIFSHSTDAIWSWIEFSLQYFMIIYSVKRLLEVKKHNSIYSPMIYIHL